jgi:hypothetical protein
LLISPILDSSCFVEYTGHKSPIQARSTKSFNLSTFKLHFHIIRI